MTWQAGAAACVLAGILAGCSAAFVPLTTDESAGLKEAQRIADEVTRHYGVPRVRVYAGAPGSARAAGTYSYRTDWIFLRPGVLTGNAFFVVLSHELGHATMSHRPVELGVAPGQVLEDLRSGREIKISPKARAAITAMENEANHRGVEILVRFARHTEREALDRYRAYFIQAHDSREGKNIMIPVGHAMPCDQLRTLWTSFGHPPPACETVRDEKPVITECPYDDWMSTGCKAGQPLPTWDTGI
jgi:hypothetical protein